MKTRLVAALVVCLMLTQALAQQDEKKEPPKSDGAGALKTLKEKGSYAIGMTIGTQLKRDSLDPDLAALMKGIKDALAGGKTLITQAEGREAMAAFQKETEAKRTDRAKDIGEKNKKEGEAFLAENKKKEGVKTLPSGLQYKVIKPGSGKSPKATDTVVTHYRGTLIDGTEFDSSYGRGEPATFQVGRVIPGWTEALQLMQVGAKWQLFIPGKLAYGERGSGPDIGPNATLIFDVELVAIK